MADFHLRVGDALFSVHTLYPDTLNLCKDYCVDETGGVEITVTGEDIDREREISIAEAKLEGLPVTNYQPGYLETTAVYRKMADWYFKHDSMVFHGALISLDGEGYLFTAKSGTGKTTHIRNWQKVFPECFVVNGDKPVLRVTDTEVRGYGTPWAGKERYQTNTSVPLKAIVLLERGAENRIEEVSFKEALPVLLSQAYRPKQADSLRNAVLLIGRIVGKVRFFRLKCNMDEESAAVAYRGMQD